MPTTREGARLPHHWLVAAGAGAGAAQDGAIQDVATQDGATQDGESARLSTHDLLHDFGAGGASGGMPNATPPRMTLLIDEAAGAPWATAAAHLRATLGTAPGAATSSQASAPCRAAVQSLRIVAVRTDPPASAASGEAQEAHEPPPAASSIAGVERLVHDAEDGWATKRQVRPDGALLVRPDGHVAWRCISLAEAVVGAQAAGAEATAAAATALGEAVARATAAPSC